MNPQPGTGNPEPGTRPPTTLLLAYDYPPRAGGIARCLGEIARHYPGGKLLVSTGAHEAAAGVDQTSPVRVDRVAVPLERLRSLGGLRRWSARVQALASSEDIGFAWAGNLKPAGYVAHILGRRRNISWGVIVYGLDLLILTQQVSRSPIKRTVARRLLTAADVTVAISRWTRDRVFALRHQLGLPDSADAVRVVPLGADPLKFRPGLSTREVRGKYALGDGRWLLTVARLMEHKGIDTGLVLLAALRDEFPDLGYAIAGSGPMRDALKVQAEHLGLGQRVRFLGQVPDGDLPALYNAASIYVGLSRELPGQVEGFGLSLLEASACGLPVLAGRGGGTADAVRDGETGLLLDPSTADEAVAAVRGVLLNPALADRLGGLGRRAVESYGNWSRVVADLQTIEAEFRSRAVPDGR